MAGAHLSLPPIPPIPPWLGRALGTALALVFAPAAPAGLLTWLGVGICLGYGLDLLLDRMRGPGTGGCAATDADGGPASVRFVFAALGRISAAGKPCLEHQNHAETLMTGLRLAPERRREALIWWHAGRDPAFPFDALAVACRAELAADARLRALAERSLCGMAALADSPRATACLLELGTRVGYTRQALASRALAMAALQPPTGPLTQARATLGVREHDSAETIRLAYRRQVARCHPDRLPPDASVEQHAAAADRMARLRDALELLLSESAR